MRFGRCLAVALLLAAGGLSGCGLIGGEADIRGTLHAFFDAAQRGEIEPALELVAPENATTQLLADLRETDPEGYENALEDMGERLRSALDGAQLHIASVVIRGERAFVAGLLIHQGRDEQEFLVEAVKREGKWLLATLPAVEMN